MLGEWSGLILQFAVAVIVVLALIGVVAWLMRRYTSGGLGRIGRGRVPRLAVIDAVSVDARRRLVLVRRDNVEHLILVGGPTDVVVEQAIQRARRPAARPQAIDGTPAETVPAVEPAPVEAPPVSEPATPVATETPPANAPIPFPQARAQSAAPAGQAAPAQQRAFFSLRRATGGPSARLEPVSSPLPTPERAEAPAISEPVAAPPAAEAPPVRLEPESRAVSSGPTNVSPFSAPPAPPRTEDTAAKVSDLEREMARLLGEITGRQSS